MSLSFEEKSVWIQLVSVAIALGAYFAVAATMHANGVDILIPYMPLLVLAVVVIVVINVAGHIVAAITGRPEKRDERDRLITWRAESNSGWILAVGAMGAITAMLFGLGDVLVAHILLASLFIAEIVGFTLQLVYYRRGV